MCSYNNLNEHQELGNETGKLQEIQSCTIVGPLLDHAFPQIWRNSVSNAESLEEFASQYKLPKPFKTGV